MPDSEVLLLGDGYYPPPSHLRGSHDVEDRGLVATLLSEDVGWYVDSHSPYPGVANA